MNDNNNGINRLKRKLFREKNDDSGRKLLIDIYGSQKTVNTISILFFFTIILTALHFTVNIPFPLIPIVVYFIYIFTGSFVVFKFIKYKMRKTK